MTDLQATLMDRLVQKETSTKWSDTTSDCDLSDFDTSPRYLSSNSGGPDDDNSTRNRLTAGTNLKPREDLVAWKESDEEDVSLDFGFDKR